MNRNPCFLCENRYVGCHGECEDYKAWRAEYDEMKKKEREEIDTREFAFSVGKRRARKAAYIRKKLLWRGGK